MVGNDVITVILGYSIAYRLNNKREGSQDVREKTGHKAACFHYIRRFAATLSPGLVWCLPLTPPPHNGCTKLRIDITGCPVAWGAEKLGSLEHNWCEDPSCSPY